MTDIAPIELPTGRRSYIAPVSGPNIHDKDWIPVLDAADLKKVQQYQEKEVSPYNITSFSPFPKINSNSNSPVVKPQFTHNYSKSLLAPESIASELEGDSLPPRTSSKKSPIGSAITSDPSSQHLRQTSADAPSSDGQETVASDGADAPSTAGTSSLLEEQYYTLPDAPISKEDIQPPQTREPTPLSARSSVASTRTKPSVLPPTSKYNRKPVASMTTSGRPPTIKSQPTTPRDSPKLLPAIPIAPPPIPQSETLPSPQTGPVELSQTTPPTTPRLVASKSSASERRARALHSHPSNVSLQSQAVQQQYNQSRSRANSSSSSGAEPMPKPPSVRHKPRKSTDSRIAVAAATTRGTIYDSQTPTPAPTTPLPQLPPEAGSRRPSLRGGQEGLGIKTAPPPSGPSHIHNQSRPASPQVQQMHPQQYQHQHHQSSPQIQAPPEAHMATTSSPLAPSRPADHTEMASFMTSTSTVMFRRFDDVHVKLLLCLQDEIGQLERELTRLDSTNMASAPAVVDKGAARVRIMRELRRVVAEYDHLFANWSQMQASKASAKTRQDLKAWLEKPTTSAGAMTLGAMEDLRWLESQKDLSSVRLDGNGGDGNEKAGSVRGGSSKGSGAGGGGLAGLFGCAGRRK